MKRFLIIILSTNALYSMQSPESRFSVDDEEHGSSTHHCKLLRRNGLEVSSVRYNIYKPTENDPGIGTITSISESYMTKDYDKLLTIYTLQEIRKKTITCRIFIDPQMKHLPSFLKDLGFRQEDYSLYCSDEIMGRLQPIQKALEEKLKQENRKL